MIKAVYSLEEETAEGQGGDSTVYNFACISTIY